MIRYADIAWVLVTRGNVDLDPILGSLPPFHEVVVWDNSTRPFDAKVFGRYLGILETRAPFIAVQDDDCIVHVWDDLREIATSHGTLVAAMKDGHREGEPPMVGWGAIFPRYLPDIAWQRWFAAGNIFDWKMARYPESILTALVRTVTLRFPAGVGHTDLPWAEDGNRSYRHPDHFEEFAKVRDEALAAHPFASYLREEREILRRERRDLARIRRSD